MVGRYGVEGSKIMVKLSVAGLLVVCLLTATPLWAAKEISVDFDTGEEAEWVHELPPVPEAETKDIAGQTLQKELARLRKVLRLQQALINRQQAAIEVLTKDLRRQKNINRGLEQLCRACR